MHPLGYGLPLQDRPPTCPSGVYLKSDLSQCPLQVERRGRTNGTSEGNVTVGADEYTTIRVDSIEIFEAGSG
jgi:hypothetical protein